MGNEGTERGKEEAIGRRGWIMHGKGRDERDSGWRLASRKKRRNRREDYGMIMIMG